MNKGDYSIIQGTVSTTRLIALPKKPMPGGEEISLGDLTIPPTLTKIRKQEPKKKLPSHSQQTTGKKFGLEYD